MDDCRFGRKGSTPPKVQFLYVGRTRGCRYICLLWNCCITELNTGCFDPLSSKQLHCTRSPKPSDMEIQEKWFPLRERMENCRLYTDRVWVKVFKHLSLFQLFISISLWYYKHMCCDVFMCVLSGYLCSSFSRPNKSIMFWCVLCLMSLYAWTVFCFNCDLSSKTFLFPVSEMREDHPICDARAQNQSLFDS